MSKFEVLLMSGDVVYFDAEWAEAGQSVSGTAINNLVFYKTKDDEEVTVATVSAGNWVSVRPASDAS